MTTRGVGVWTGTCCILNTGHRKIAKKPVFQEAVTLSLKRNNHQATVKYTCNHAA